MFTKVALAVAIILGTASASLAMTKKPVYNEPEYFKQATGAEWWKI